MATVKRYVDLTGLTTFRDSLKIKFAANTSTDWVVNYASNAGKATSDENGANIVSTYLKQSDATNTYAPLTREIAGLNLNGNITAEALRKAINVEDGSEKNIIEAITIDGVAQIIGSDRNVALDLSNYAKKSDITAVLKFMGVVTGVDKLPKASADQVGHVYIVASGKEGDAYAEYVCVDNNGETEGGYTWEKLGNGASLDGYYTKEEINAKFNELSLGSTGADGSFISTVSQTAGKVSASTTAFATSVAESVTIAPTSGAVYTAIDSAKSALMGTGAGDTGSTIKKNEASIATLNGEATVEGSVAKKIKDAIGALDYNEVTGDYVTSVTQANGKVTVTRASKGSVTDGNTGLVDGGTVHSFVTTHVTNAIQGLDVTAVGGDGKFIQAISEADGKILPTFQTFDTAIPDSNPSNIVAPTTSAFKDYSDSAYVAISSVSSEEISQLFIPKSKTKAFITGTIEVAESDIVTSIADYAFCVCNSLTSVSFPVATSIGVYAFSECSNLTSISFPVVTSIGEGAFQGCSSLTSVSFPVATSIGERAFQNCSGLTSVFFPKATSIGNYAFEYCSGLTTIYVGTESDTVCTLSSTNAIPSSVTDIYVSYSLVDSYKSAPNWSSFADKIKADRVPVECISLSITADDVAVGNETSTTVYYTAECTYTRDGILQEGTTVFTGKGISNSFEHNTSTTDTVQRTVSFTFMGKTATTTITQGVWINRSISVTTSGISKYGWEPAGSEYGYDVYRSNNQGKSSSQAVMKLECSGYTDLTLYIRSYAESTFDYTIASKVNVKNYPKDYYSSDVKAHTSGKQNSGTTLKDYTKVEYTGLKDNDIIYIVFKKDSSGDKGDDRGYVLIPKA